MMALMAFGFSNAVKAKEGLEGKEYNSDFFTKVDATPGLVQLLFTIPYKEEVQLITPDGELVEDSIITKDHAGWMEHLRKICGLSSDFNFAPKTSLNRAFKLDLADDNQFHDEVTIHYRFIIVLEFDESPAEWLRSRLSEMADHFINDTMKEHTSKTIEKLAKKFEDLPPQLIVFVPHWGVQLISEYGTRL